MKSPALQLCIATVLAVLCLAACNKGGGAGRPAAQQPAGQTAPVAAAPLSGPGYAVYMGTGCKACHGEDLAGSGTLGPPLKGLSAHWNAGTLKAYLRDPQFYAKTDERLAAEQQKYTMLMPAMPMNDADMESLVAFLLEQ